MPIRSLFAASAFMACFAVVPLAASAQGGVVAAGSVNPADPPASLPAAPSTQPDSTYHRPTEKANLRNYGYDTLGPLPVATALVEAGFDQEGNAPPEWGQGFTGYSERFGSDFGIELVGTTTRYALAEAFREDTHYYPCTCKGFMPRLGHALLGTLTARSGEEGHTVFSVPSLVAPYAGSMTAVYGWYPSRYGAKDAFRMGNYTLLGYAGSNVVFEFFYRGPLSRFSHLRWKHTQDTTGPATTP
jgi:hypothetical protein